jgi:hypothetical protein
MIGSREGVLEMPVLPLIDLLLLAGWTSLFAGFVLKAIALTTTYNPSILGMSSIDFFLVAMASMLFAIALAARTWVKAQEPAARALRLHKETMDAWRALPGNQEKNEEISNAEQAISNQANQAS